MNATDIVAYTYEADYHCVDCTRKRFTAGGFTLDDPLGNGPGLDEHGIDYRATDHDGNAVHPVFGSDEWEDEVCGDCACAIG